MGLMPRALLRLALFACLIVPAMPADGADRVAVSGDVGKGLGRLEFIWPRAVLYDARVILGRLVVQFSEPGDFDFSAYRNAMPQYLGDPTVVADGAVIAFPLRVPVSLRHRQDGARITIELHDEHALPDLSTAAGPDEEPEAAETQADARAGAPADVTADAAPDAAANDAANDAAADLLDAPPIETFAGPANGPPLDLRIGDHPGFSRLVFDWPSAVAYSIEQRGRRVVIDFEAAAELDLSNFRRRGLDNVSEIAAETGESGLSVTLQLAEQLLVRHFLSGSHVVVDLVHDEDVAQIVLSALVVEPEPLTEAAAASTAEPVPDAAPVTPAAQASLAPSDQELPEYGPDNGPDNGPENGPGSDEAGSEPQPLANPETDPEAGPETDPEVTPTSGPTPGLAAGGEGELSIAEVREVDRGDSATAPGAQVGARNPVLLRFDWPSGAGRAAVFRRGRHLWIVFDQPVADGASGRIAKNLPDLAPVERLAAENAPATTVLRLNLPAGFVPALQREDRAWIVDLQPRPDEPQTAIGLEYVTETPDPRIRFSVGGARGVLSVRDPDLGDRLEIVPVPLAGQGLNRPRRFLQFRALATYQGLAIIPLSDGLVVETRDSGVIVRDAAGLLVSPGADRDHKLRDSNDFESGLRLFDLEDWRRADRGNSTEVRRALLDSVVAAPPEGVAAARLDLARFYFAHGLATEALGVLRLISQEYERLASDPQVRLLRAASEFLANNYARAAELLNDPVLSDERDALPWQAAVAAISRDWPSAVDRFAAGAPLIADYDPRVRARLHLLAAEAGLGIGDSDSASRYLVEVLKDDPNLAEQAQLDHLLGRRAKMDGDTDGARLLWQKVAAGSHRPSRARARLALVELGLETGSLPVKDAIAGLERLRSDWRGDGFELALLQRLAELHVAAGDYGSALGALREAVSELPDSPYAAEAGARLGEIFTDVMLAGQSESLAPQTALSLYREFKDLIPAGSDGERAIARLADRLVEAGRFDAAATLLADQVAERLHGEEKVRTGARLAWIRLLERKPVLALTALNASLPEAGFASLPDQLERDRRHLRARALALLGRTAEALALLGGDDSAEALRLNAEILWSEKQWLAASRTLEKLAPTPADGQALSQGDSEVLLNLAVAYSLSGQHDGLSRIGDDYGAAMAATVWRDDFARLTGEPEDEETLSVANELADAARFEAFTSKFKDRLASSEASGLN